MSSEVLSRAAALMREHAEAASNWGGQPWFAVGEAVYGGTAAPHQIIAPVTTYDGDAQHIASWHPTLALRISDWLLRVADDVIRDNYEPHEYESAVDIANLYLGEQQP